MEKKFEKTQKEMYADAIALAEANGRNDLVDFFKSRIEMLEKKATNKKPTKEQEANVERKAESLKVLTDEGVTVTDLIKKSEYLTANEVSVARATALLTQMVKDKTVVNYKDGKKSLYKLA